MIVELGKQKNIKNIIFAAVLAVLQVGIIVASAVQKTDFLFPVALSLWMYAVAYCIYDIKNNIQMLTYLLMFYLFILGGQVAHSILKYRYNVPFKNQYDIHTNTLIILALIFIFLGYILVTRIGLKKTEQRLTKEDNYEKNKELRLVSSIAFYFSSVFWIIDLVHKALYVRVNGYYALYADFNSHLPYPCRILAGFAPFAFYIFLACKPKKRETYIPLAVFVLCTAASVFTGRRVLVAVSILILVIFFFTSDANTDDSKEKWITKPFIIGAVIFLPLLIIAFQVYSRTRVGKDLNFTRDVINALKSFLCSQGYTVNIIKYERHFANELPTDKLYSFCTSFRFLRTSPLTRSFMPAYDFVYGELNAASALNGNNFANTISYLVQPDKFITGWGTGSCFLAELFHDFGYLGAAIGSAVYGVLLGLMKRLWNRSVIAVVVSYIVLDKLLLTPRYNFDYFLDGFTSLPKVALIVLVFASAFLLKMIRKKCSK